MLYLNDHVILLFTPYGEILIRCIIQWILYTFLLSMLLTPVVNKCPTDFM